MDNRSDTISQQSTGFSYYLKWGATFLAAVVVVLILLSEPVYTNTILKIVPGVSRLKLLIVFVLAGFFPISAFAYVSFQRKTQLRKLAGDFWLLGIDIRGMDIPKEQAKNIHIPQVLEELEPKHYNQYFNLLEEQTHVSLNYVIQSILTVLATILGLSLFSWLPTEKDFFPIPIHTNTLHALQFGFLGAYIYSLQLIYRRYTTLDLQPTVYLNCTLTLIAGIVFNFVAFEAINSLSSNPAATQVLIAGQPASVSSTPATTPITITQEVTGTEPVLDTMATIPITTPTTMPITTAQQVSGTVSVPAQTTAASEPSQATGLAGGLLAIIAFSLGYFPYLAIRWFNRIGHTTLGEKLRRADALQLDLIDGISQFHEVRLRDEGIDNVQNLASASLDELLINTRFSAKQVIEWVDQAVLYLYLEPSEIDSFRRGGVRSYSDLEYLWGPLYEVYYVTGNPSRKIIETFRRSKTTYSLLDQKSQDFSERLLTQWKQDSQPSAEATLQNQPPTTFWDEERKNRALQLFQSLPERLDALYLATKLGPNVAHIKNYWRRADELQSHLQDQFKILKKVTELFMEIGAIDKLDPVNFSFDNRLQHSSYLWYWELKKKGKWDQNETWQEHEGVEIEEEKRNIVQLGKARVASVVGNTTEAITAYNEVVRRDPNRAYIRSEFAGFYLNEHEKEPKKEYLDEALKFAEKAVELAEGADLNNEISRVAHDSALKVLAVVKERLAKAETDTTKKEGFEKEAKDLRAKISPTGRSSGGWDEINLQAKQQQDELQTVIDSLKQVIAGSASIAGASVTGTQQNNGQLAPIVQPEASPVDTESVSADRIKAENMLVNQDSNRV